VKLRTEHDFAASLAAVEAALLDGAFWQSFQFPDLGPSEVVATTVNSIELHMAYEGSLDPLAQRLIGSESVSWTQSLSIDDEHRGTITIAPDGRAARMSVTATFVLTRTGDDTTHRALDADLRVRVPLVGGKAEHKLAPGIERRFEIEAQALANWLRDHQ
jgi:hypothetical protein